MIIDCFCTVVFVTDCVVCGTVSKLSYLSVGDFRFDLVGSNCECGILSEVILYG